MANLAVAVADQAVEELAQPHLAARSLARAEDLAKRLVEHGGGRQVVAGAVEDQGAGLREPGITRIGEDREQAAHKAPPIAQGRARQLAERLDEVGLGLPGFGKGDDGCRGQQPQRGLPEEIGRLVPVEGVLGVVRAAVEPSQRQGETACQVLVAGLVAVHGGIHLMVWDRSRIQHNGRAHGHKARSSQTVQIQRTVVTASPVFHLLHRVHGS
jgi:hypothetical protein